MLKGISQHPYGEKGEREGSQTGNFECRAIINEKGRGKRKDFHRGMDAQARLSAKDLKRGRRLQRADKIAI